MSSTPDSQPEAARGTSQLTQEAVARAKAGDTEGLHYLYVRYADDVLRYVTSFVRDHHEAEDITQNVFAKLMKAIKKYEQREVPFDAWILRVARNAALDHLRAKRAIPTEEVQAHRHRARPDRPRSRSRPARGAGRPARGSARGARPPAHRRPLPGRDRRHPRQDRELGSRASPSRPALAAGQPGGARRGAVVAPGRPRPSSCVGLSPPDSRSSRMRWVMRPASSSAAK